MGGQVYFGNTEKAAFIPAPRSNALAPHVGTTALLQLANGGAVLGDSTAEHREFNFEWVGDPSLLSIIKQFKEGVFGPGPYWWVDPFAQDTNLFSPNWAAPRLAEGDWKPIYDKAPTTIAATTANAYLHPTKMATYDLTSLAVAGVPLRRFTILIPPTKTLYVGASGSATLTGVVAVRPVLVSTGAYDTVVTNAPLAVTGATRLFSNAYSGATYSRVEVYLSKTAADASTIMIASMIARMWDTGTTPVLTGTFVSGEGTTGLRFSGGITDTLYTAGGRTQPRQRGYAVKLVETEQWEL